MSRVVRARKEIKDRVEKYSLQEGWNRERCTLLHVYDQNREAMRVWN